MTDFSKDFNLDFRQETMDTIQMRKYVDLEIFKQGSASAKVLAPLFTLETSVLEKYNSSADWAEVRSAVEANSKIVIA